MRRREGKGIVVEVLMAEGLRTPLGRQEGLRARTRHPAGLLRLRRFVQRGVRPQRL